MNATDFATGMTVHGRDGGVLGVVVEVWVHAPSHGMVPMSRHLSEHGKREAAVAANAGYLQVRRRSFFKLRRRDLYVPFSAVRAAASRTTATLRYPSASCEEWFGRGRWRAKGNVPGQSPAPRPRRSRRPA